MFSFITFRNFSKTKSYDTFVHHQLEPSWEHVICCFVRSASCYRCYTNFWLIFWPLQSFNISVLEKKTLWHNFGLFSGTKRKLRKHLVLGLFLLVYVYHKYHSALADSIKLHLVRHSSAINIHSQHICLDLALMPHCFICIYLCFRNFCHLISYSIMSAQLIW